MVLASGCGKGKDPRRGDAGMPCSADSDCDDGIPCTADTCGVGGVCRANPIDERCMGGTVCDPAMGCITEMECSMDSECDDTIDCTLDACGVGGVCNHMALNERCMAGEACDPSMGGCVAGSGCGSDADCDDSIACTLVCTWHNRTTNNRGRQNTGHHRILDGQFTTRYQN